MAQKISQMTEQTTSSMTEAGTSDFLGGYTATGGNANRKFSLSGLANYFLNKFKMTLGGSSQTVKSAIDALNSNSYLLTGGTELTQNTNIDTITTPGNYGTYSSNVARTMSGLPFTTGSSDIFAFNLKVEHAAFNQEGIVRQTLRFFNDRYAYIRYKMSSSSSWGTWEKTPTRSEIDALNSKTVTEISSSISENFTVVNSSQSKSVIITYSSGLVLVKCTVHCDTTCTGSQEVCHVPLVRSDIITVGGIAWINYYDGTTFKGGLIQNFNGNGHLYINGGTAGSDYNITVCYPSS